MGQSDYTKSKIDDLYIVPEFVQEYIIKRGLKKSPVLIDALAFKVYDSVPFEEVERCFAGLLDFSIPVNHNFFGYTCAKMTETGHSLKLTLPSEASVSAGTVYSSGEAYYSITGRDCALLNKNYLMENVVRALNRVGNEYPFNYVDFTGEHHHCSGIQFKRIDLCRDCFDDRFDYLFQYDESELNNFIISKNKNFQWVRSASSGSWNPGWTLYNGKRKSQVFTRLYDKRAEQGLDKASVQQTLGFDIPHWCRLEFECKFEKPQEICARICDGEDLTDIYRDLVLERFQVKPALNEGITTRSYADVADWLLDFCEKDKFCEESAENIIEIEHCKMHYSGALLRTSLYKHFTQQRVATWQKQLVRYARDRSPEQWIDMVREAQALYGDCDIDKDIYTAWNGDRLVSMNKLQYDSALSAGLVESSHPATCGVLTEFDVLPSQRSDWKLADSMRQYRLAMDEVDAL